jgi:hypothetical protein
LSSGSETYEIAVRFPIVASATIKVDGERVSKGWEIAGRTYHLSSLSSKLGSDVTIQVNMTSERAVRSLILKIGDQVLKYPDK